MSNNKEFIERIEKLITQAHKENASFGFGVPVPEEDTYIKVQVREVKSADKINKWPLDLNGTERAFCINNPGHSLNRLDTLDLVTELVVGHFDLIATLQKEDTVNYYIMDKFSKLDGIVTLSIVGPDSVKQVEDVYAEV